MIAIIAEYQLHTDKTILHSPQGKVRQRFNKALASFFVHDRFSAIVCFDFDNFDRRQPHFLIHLE